jgi:hypothetical protein
LSEDAIDVFGAWSVAIDQQVVALSADADMEERLEVLEVLVVGAEERLDAFFRNRNSLADCLYLLILQRVRWALYHS